jgi:hypothetical protein
VAVTVDNGDSCAGRMRVGVCLEKFEGRNRVFAADNETCWRPSTMTVVEVREQIDQSISNNQRIETD